MRWLDGITDGVVMNLGKLWEMVKDGGPGMLQSMGSRKDLKALRLWLLIRSRECCTEQEAQHGRIGLKQGRKEMDKSNATNGSRLSDLLNAVVVIK